MNRQRLVGVMFVVAGAGTLFASTTYSTLAARQAGFADRLTGTSGWYLVASAACAAVGLFAIGIDVIRRGG